MTCFFVKRFAISFTNSTSQINVLLKYFHCIFMNQMPQNKQLRKKKDLRDENCTQNNQCIKCMRIEVRMCSNDNWIIQRYLSTEILGTGDHFWMAMRFTGSMRTYNRLLGFNIEISAKWDTLQQAQLQHNSRTIHMKKNKNTNFRFKKYTEITENHSS